MQSQFTARKCSFQDCGRKYARNGYCDTHAKQIERGVGPYSVKGFRWSEVEIQGLIDWYKKNPNLIRIEEFASKIGRTRMAVFLKASELGLCNRNRKWYVPKRVYGNMQDFHRELPRLARENIRKYGHPRGFRGLHHSDETKMAIKAKMEEVWHLLSDEQKKEINQKAKETCIERYGRYPAKRPTENTYSRCRRGKRIDLMNQFFRSSWEANYARYLNWLIENEEIESWTYEPTTFVFHEIKKGVLSYTPDFEVVELNGVVSFHEVKGWFDSKSKTRHRRMAKYYPSVKIVLVDAKAYKAIGKTVSKLIPFWE